MSAKAFYSEEDRCWYVPVASELFDDPDKVAAEPVRVEIKDGRMWITRLEPSEADRMIEALADVISKQIAKSTFSRVTGSAGDGAKASFGEAIR